MKRFGSLLWIIILLAALFMGPTVIVDREASTQETPSLRAVIEQERLLDAPAPLPTTP